jgi:hypothetical protein
MSWPKFSDNFPDDCWTLSDAAFRLHTEALCWNGRKLLDCRIPKGELARFAKHPDASAELVAEGYWAEDGDCYVIRHHAEHQRTREQAISLQERNRVNGRRGGRPPKNPSGNPDGNPDGNPKGEERRGEENSLRGAVSREGTQQVVVAETGEISAIADFRPPRAASQ